MFIIYVIEMPINYYPRIMAFSSRNKAQEVCDMLNKGKGATSKIIDVCEMKVYENADIQVMKETE
jgi:hypothetical protein